MLERLQITDFAVARSVEVCPGPGLSVFTGETGAGKSLIVDALAFVCGARRGRDVIASGAAKATVTATFTVGGACHLLERSIGLSGRSSASVHGEPGTTAQLLDVGSRAVEIHGQFEQLAILRPAEQLDVLDAFAGLREQREQVARSVRSLRDVRRRIESLSTDSRERERLVEQLTFETNEIGAAALVEGEDEGLRADRLRLTSVRTLRESGARALEYLEAAALGEIASAVAEIGERDPSVPGLTDLAVLLESTADDLSRELRRYAEGLEDDPERLSALDERLDAIARLRRKYGESIADILAYGQEAAARLASISGAHASVEDLRRHETELLTSRQHLWIAVLRLNDLHLVESQSQHAILADPHQFVIGNFQIDFPHLGLSFTAYFRYVRRKTAMSGKISKGKDAVALNQGVAEETGGNLFHVSHGKAPIHQILHRIIYTVAIG